MAPTAKPSFLDEALKPDFSHAEQFRRHIEAALQNVGWRLLLLIAAAALVQMGTLALEPQSWTLRIGRMGTAGAVLLLCLGSALMTRRWGLRVAMAFFCLSAGIALIGSAYTHGIGLYSSGMPGLLLITLVAAFLSGRRVMWAVTLMSIGGLVLLAVAHEMGWIVGPTPLNTPPPGSFIVVYLAVLLLCAWLVTRFSAIFWQATSSLQSAHELLLKAMQSQRDSSEELRRSEQRLRGLLDGALFGIQIVDAETAAIRYANDQALATFGCQSLEELGDSLMNQGREELRANFLKRVHSAAKDGPQHFAWQATRKDGTALWLDLKLDRLEFNGDRQVVIFIHDVSARALAEAELRQHRARLQDEVAARTAEQQAERQRMQEIIEALPITLSIRSPVGRFMMVNRYFEQAVGRSRDEVLGRSIKDLFDPDHAAEMLTRDEQVLRDGQPVTVEEQVRHPLTGARDYLTTSVPLTDYRGRPYAVLNLGTDVTMLKTLQRELSSARDEAQASAKAKGEFLANMSHEIRTPLNAMLGLAQLGRRNLAGSPPPAQTFERILRAGRHLQGVIDDVLDFTRIESGKLDVDLLPVHLPALVEEVMELVSDRAREKGLDLKSANQAAPSWVLLDPLRVSQVLVNLLANAIKFTAHGEVRLSLDCTDKLLTLSVSDTGPGIPKEHQERIFHAFEQADASTTRKYGASGLGLDISRRQVEAMGGTLTLESEPGRGATFTVALPLRLAAAPESLPDEPAMDHDLAGVRVLVVDDVDINREILRDMLSQFGVETTPAASGEEAIERVRQAGPAAFDLVLMDVQMPDMDGYETAAALRHLAPELPMVAVTAHAMAEHRQHSLEAGMKDHLTKPVDVDALKACISRHALAGKTRPHPAPLSSHSNPPPPLAQAGTGAATVQVDRATDGAASAQTPDAGWPAMPGVDFEAALRRCAGQLPLLQKLLRQFSHYYAQHPELFETARRAGSQPLQSTAHRLKGAAGNLGMTGLAALAASVEQRCAGESTEDAIQAALDALGHSISTHLHALQQWLPPSEASSASAPSVPNPSVPTASAPTASAPSPSTASPSTSSPSAPGVSLPDSPA